MHPVVGVFLLAGALLADIGAERLGLGALGVVAVGGNAVAGGYGADTPGIELDGQALALRIANQAVTGTGNAKAPGEVEAVVHR